MKERKEFWAWFVWLKDTARDYRKQFWQITLVSLFFALLNSVAPYMWKLVVDNAAAKVFSQRIILIFAAILLVSASALPYRLLVKLKNLYRFDKRNLYLDHLLKLDSYYHKLPNKKSTTVMQEVKNGIDAGADTIERILNSGQFLTTIPVALVGIGYTMYHNVLAAACLIAFMLFLIKKSSKLGKLAGETEKKFQILNNSVSSRIQEVIQNFDTIRLFSAEEMEKDWLRTEGQKLLELQEKNRLYYARLAEWAALSRKLPYLLCLAFFVMPVTEGTMTVGTLFALMMYGANAVSPVSKLGETYQILQADWASLKLALDILDEKPVITESLNPERIGPLQLGIEFRDVTFQYPGANEPIIQNLSLRIERGQRVAIVGESGEGKTTLAKLLLRYYNLSSGKIHFDDVDISNCQRDSLYEQIAYFDQQVPLFSRTIMENICLGRDNYNGFIRACSKASAEFVLQRGMNSTVGEQGSNLSGGEKQRIALARILMGSPSVIILDEATSNLDRNTERDIQETFDQLLKVNHQTTLITIAHRLSTITHSDKIFVLGNKQIIDSGTHDELLSRCSFYQELCRDMK